MLTTGHLSGGGGLYNNELSLFLLLLQIDYFFFNFNIDSFGVCLWICYVRLRILRKLPSFRYGPTCDTLKIWWRTYDPDNDGQLNVSRRLSRRLNKAMSQWPVVCPLQGQRQDSGPWRIDLQVSHHLSRRPVAFYDQPIRDGRAKERGRCRQRGRTRQW